MPDNDVRSRELRRKETSRAAYLKSKNSQDHVLLRLSPGSRAKLDAGRVEKGLSRSAYVEALLFSSTESRGAPPYQVAEQPVLSIGDQFEALFGNGG
jgi:hypothetical protein